ncbi:outer membrane beta-barrel protein [Stappia sp. F7233]|uniref:Outer membrane beta-barrel protein n=1 Tax=Stappia albiluteola TaxID=2758565 RepID=A0A839ACH4_9HYPH|nr:outer membrane beta-barrel protein [Stappia albiluteola]MBA5777343.1 outer membrane beta-barrel protein [Stappia albiluteola]
MFRLRNHFLFLALSLPLAGLPPLAARAQDAGLRGAIDAGDTGLIAAGEEPFDAIDPASDVGTTDSGGPNGGSSSALPLASTGEAVEQLAPGGRTRPVQPFSERLRALNRQLPTAGESTPEQDGVFGGDTIRDQAQGLRAGTFLLYSELFTGLGWTDNAAGAAGGSPGGYYRVAPSLRATSNWSRHELGVSLRGSFTGFPQEPSDNDPFFNANADLRLDLSDETVADVIGRYTFSTEERGTAEASGTNQDVHELGLGLRLSRDVGLVGVTAGADADYTTYVGVDVPGSVGDRDNVVAAASLRLDGLSGATAAPFVEGSLLGRHYVEGCTGVPGCEDRDSTGYALRGGLTLDAGPKLRGELGAGWRVEYLEEQGLDNLQGLLVDGSLIWSPTRLTTVTASVDTTFEGTTIVGASGSIIYSGDLVLSHSLSDDLAVEAGVGYSLRRYEGIFLEERDTTATAALTWAFASNIALQTRYTFHRFDTTQAGGDYDANTIEAGLRFRH